MPHGKDEDPRVAETAVVGYGHEDYGEGIYLVVTMETSMCNYHILQVV